MEADDVGVSYIDSVNTSDKQEESEDNVRSVENPLAEAGLIPAPSMFDAEDFGEFSQDFAWESGMAVTQFLVSSGMAIGLTFLFYYYDAPYLIPVMLFGFFIVALSYSLLRSNNRVRISCDFFGFLAALAFQFPGWVEGNAPFDWNDDAHEDEDGNVRSMLCSIGLSTMCGLGISWVVRVLMTQFPRLFGQWKYEIDYTEKRVIDQLKTGDVILTSHVWFTSVVIKFASASNFSHAAMIVRHPSQKIKDLFYISEENNNEDPHGVYVLESDVHFLESWEDVDIPDLTEQRHAHAQRDMRTTGVQLVPLDKWICHYIHVDGEDTVVVVKPLNAPQGVRCPVEHRHKERSLRTSATNIDDSTFSAKMDKYMQDMCRCPYELSNFQLYGAVFGWNRKSDLSSLFCSELVCGALQAVGAISQKRVQANNVSPVDFNRPGILPFRRYWYLGPSMRLMHKDALENRVPA